MFEKVAQDYWKNGFSVIPIDKFSKRPAPELGLWGEYNNAIPTEEQQNSMLEKFKGCGIGVICGAISGVCAIDIDVDELTIDERIPRSPCVRRGAKGEVRFFRYNPNLKNFSIRGVMDFMATNKYIVLPPSRHPDTGFPYEWIGEIKTLDKEILPDLPDNIEAVLTEAFSDFEQKEGRNNKYTKMVHAKFHDGKDFKEVLAEMIEFDAFQERPLFSDPNEPYYASRKTVEGAAEMFIRSQERTFKRINKKIDLGLPIDETPIPLAPRAPVPKSEMLFKLYSTICSKSRVENYDISLGGALSIMSAVVANRFAVRIGEQKTGSNIYAILLADSGSGKNSAISTASRILAPYGLLGTMQKSGSSFLKFAYDQRQKLEICDEVSALLKTMGSKNMTQSELVEYYTGIFSQSCELFVVPQSLTLAKSSVGTTMWNPCISLLGATTPAGLAETLKKSMGGMGFLPRILFFKQEFSDFYTDKAVNYTMELEDKIARFIQNNEIKLLRPPTNASPDMERDIRYLELTPQALQWHEEKLVEFHIEQGELHARQDPRKDYVARKMELILKVALIDAVSDARADISLQNMLFAESVYNYSFFHVSNIIDNELQTHIDTPYSICVSDVESFIKTKGIVSAKELAQKLRRHSPDMRRKVLSDLCESGVIIETEEKTDTKPRKYYSLAGISARTIPILKQSQCAKA